MRRGTFHSVEAAFVAIKEQFSVLNAYESFEEGGGKVLLVDGVLYTFDAEGRHLSTAVMK